MSFFRDLGGAGLRRARSLEAGGDFRAAAKAYAELSMFVEAAKCLLHEGEKASTLESRIGAWMDAALVLPPEATEMLREIDVKIGRAVLEQLRPSRVVGGNEKRQLTDAAERLERAEQWRDAADAWELLGRTEDLARCLEQGGEVDRLERVLSDRNRSDAASDRIRRLLSEHDLAMELGQRSAARRALAEAAALAPGDAAIAASLRRLDERAIRGTTLRLSIGSGTIRVIGKLPLVIGRADADLALRGGSVSRRHAEVAREGERFVLRDLGSRNGTLVSGVVLSRAMAVDGALEVGLGDDVAITLTPREATMVIEVVRGLDRGEVAIAGEGRVVLDELGAAVRFEPDRAILYASSERLRLGDRVVSSVDLLVGDVITIGARRVEVVA